MLLPDQPDRLAKEDRAMSAPATVTAPPRKRRFLRLWLPLILVVLYGAALAADLSIPDESPQVLMRTPAALALTVLFVLLFVLWFVAFSGLRWWVRLGVVAVLAALPFALIDGWEHTSGNIVPIFHYRWQPTREAALAAWHQQHQGDHPAAAATDLAGDRPTDYPGYRGRQRDAVVREGPELARSWATPPRLLWRHPCGGGYAGIAVAGNSAVTIEQRGDKEAVVCYDTDTGLERWVHDYPARFLDETHMGGNGPRATPTIADGDVYSLGGTGELVCLNAADGKLRWQVNILEGNKNVMWGMSGSPLVFDRFVVVNPGKQEKDRSPKYGAVTAFDRKTGELVWNAGDAHAGYSSPGLATLAGKRQVLLFDQEGISGYDADKGKGTVPWHLDWKTPQQPEIKVAQPIVLPGDRLFVSSSYGGVCAMLKVAPGEDGKQKAMRLWENMKMRCRFTSPVADDHFLYGLDEGVLVCLDQETGAVKWRAGRYGHGQLLRAGDLLLIQAEDGELALVEATGDAFRELGRFPALGSHTWNCPALADGKAYVRNDKEMACYDLRPAGQKSQPPDAPPPGSGPAR
jgi:outer membrane protein assembly factor BamB